MWTPLRKHCSDEQLLASADGELDIFRSAWVKAHLELCWDCRARKHELEAQASRLSRILRHGGNLDSEQLSRAKAKFQRWQREYERELAEARELVRFSAPAAGIRVPVWATIFALVLLAIVASVPRRQPRNEAADLLSQSTGAQARLFQTSAIIHQTFRVKVTEVEPERRDRTGEIEVWSDAEGRRFASRWKDASGALRHAVWRPRAGQQFYFNPKRGSAATVQSLADLSDFAVDLDRLESGLMDWIETRRWKPIELGADMRLFSSRGGTLRVERTGSRICLQAEEVKGASRIQFLLELKPGSYEPSIQTVRFEMPGRVMQIELAAGKCELVDSERLTPAVFEPERAPAPEHFVSLPPAPVGTPPVPELRTDADDLTVREIEVEYALHLAGACLGEQVAVVPVRDGSGHVQLELQGLVETGERRLELVRAVSGLPALKVNLKTTEDALKDSASGASAPESSAAAGTRVSNRTLGIDRDLEQMFTRQPPNNSLSMAENIAQFSTRAVSFSQRSLAEAWALRRLVDQHEDRAIADLPPQSRWLLEVMLRDHISAMRAETEQARVLLEPLLGPPGEISSVVPELPAGSATGWKAEVLGLFEMSRQMDALVRAIFAGAEAPTQEAETSAAPGSSPVPELARVVAALRSEFARLDSCLSSGRRPWLVACER